MADVCFPDYFLERKFRIIDIFDGDFTVSVV